MAKFRAEAYTKNSNVMLRPETLNRLIAIQKPRESYDGTITRLLDAMVQLAKQVGEMERESEDHQYEVMCMQKDD